MPPAVLGALFQTTLQMRLTLMACLLGCSLWSQTTKPAPKKKANTTTVAKPKPPTKAELELGKSLIDRSDCVTCHQPEGTLIGPGFKDVALKYTYTEANVISLANKIKNGGSGVWGDNAMSPHSDLTPDECKKIARYILSFK